MKVKNLMFSGFAAAMFAGVIGGADAATYNLASKDYVDTKITAVDTAIEKKQDKLTAGAGVTITESDDGLTTTIDTKPVMIGENEVSVADAIKNITDDLGEIPEGSTVQGEIDTLQTDKEDVANKVETETEYEALGDQDDKTKLYTSVAVAEAIAQSIATSTTTDVINRVGTLETTVGDANSGLVKDVDALETTVGDANSGLVKDVADLKSADTTMGDRVDALETDVGTLETTVGDANSGLVKDVDALETTVGDANSGLVKDVDALETTVGDANSGLVKDVKTLQDANYINTDGKDLGGYIIKADGQGGYQLLDVAIVDGTGEKDLITNADIVTVTD